MSDKLKKKPQTKDNKKKDTISTFILYFSIIYILIELTFHLGLIASLSSKNTAIESFHSLEIIGRILSSIGIALFLSRFLLLFKKIEKVWAYGVFFLVLVLSFSSQTLIFGRILDNMTPEQKLSAYTFGVYRDLHLNSQEKVKLFNEQDPTYDYVLNSMLGVLHNVPSLEQRIVKSSQLFFYKENQLNLNDLSQIYDELNISLPNIDDYWHLYYVESRRYEVYRGLFQKQYFQNFTQSIGMPPSLPKNEFITRLKKASPSLNEFNNVVLIPEKPEFHLKELKLGNIPEGLNKQQWINFVYNHINQSVERNSFQIKNVEILPHSKTIISSVVIAPITLILSLISLLMNIVLFIARWTKVGAGILFILLSLYIFTGSYNPYGLNKYMGQVLEFETKLIKSMSFYNNIIHQTINNNNQNVNIHPYKIVYIIKPTLPKNDNLKAELNNKFKELRSTGNQISYAETQNFSTNLIKDNPFSK